MDRSVQSYAPSTFQFKTVVLEELANNCKSRVCNEGGKINAHFINRHESRCGVL